MGEKKNTTLPLSSYGNLTKSFAWSFFAIFDVIGLGLVKVPKVSIVCTKCILEKYS